jgi:hypothetical protein
VAPMLDGSKLFLQSYSGLVYTEVEESEEGCVHFFLAYLSVIVARM